MTLVMAHIARSFCQSYVKSRSKPKVLSLYKMIVRKNREIVHAKYKKMLLPLLR